MDTTFFRQISLQWRYVGDVLQRKWNGLLDIIGDDPQMLWVFYTCLLVFVVYWTYAAIFTLMDITNRPRFLRKYKIQPGKNEPVDNKKLINAIKTVCFNLVVIQGIFTYVAYRVLFTARNSTDIRTLPSVFTVLWNLVVYGILEEIMFYYVHRLLHHKSVYKYVHKKHHEWTAPIAAMTLYCHPIEHVFSNILPVAISIALMGSHIFTAWLIFSLSIVNSMSDHTGYCFPFSASSVRFHDFHHEKFNYNFGVFGWLDKFHGTYREPADAVATTKASPANKKNGVKANGVKKNGVKNNHVKSK